MTDGLRIGIVGAGVFGGYHADKIISHPRATLSGIWDRDRQRCRDANRARETPAHDTLETLIANSDALIVACPASGHFGAAMAVINAGKHVLIEKPLATTLKQAEAIVKAANAAGVLVQVGHQERFVAEVIGLDHIDVPPTAIRAWRHTPYSDRGTDVSVALDLMTHDIDLVLWLMGEDPLSVEGTAAIVRSDTPDRAEATLSFSVTTAWLSASRVADAPKRRMEIEYPSGRIEVDFIMKTLTNTSDHPVVANFADDARAADSLGAATDSFIRAVLDGDPVLITGGMGMRALKYALEATGEAT